jgi:hypothetical protein
MATPNIHPPQILINRRLRLGNNEYVLPNADYSEEKLFSRSLNKYGTL